MGTKGFFYMQTLLFIIVGEQKQKNLTRLGSLKRDSTKVFSSFFKAFFHATRGQTQNYTVDYGVYKYKALDNLLLMTESL